MGKIGSFSTDISITNDYGIEQSLVEVIELKGIGHPDSLADGISEAVSKLFYSKSKELDLPPYIYSDKVLIVPGESKPEFGKGKIITPFEIIVPYLSNLKLENETITKTVYQYLSDTLSNFCKEYAKISIRPRIPSKHSFETNLKFPAEFEDSSVAVAYAPLSNSEKFIKDLSSLLSSKSFLSNYPAIGEDIKLILYRRNKKIKLIIACAFVCKYISDLNHYLEIKKSLKHEISIFSKPYNFDEIIIEINPDDRIEINSIYLTVIGTSAEHGDCGVTGRGNRWNGLISPLRPMTIEAIAGKNLHNHPARLLNTIAQKISMEIYNEFKIREVIVLVTGNVGGFIKDLDQIYIKINTTNNIKKENILKLSNYWLDQFNNAMSFEQFYSIANVNNA